LCYYLGSCFLLVMHKRETHDLAGRAGCCFGPGPVQGRWRWTAVGEGGRRARSRDGLVSLDRRALRWSSTAPCRLDLRVRGRPGEERREAASIYLPAGLRGARGVGGAGELEAMAAAMREEERRARVCGSGVRGGGETIHESGMRGDSFGSGRSRFPDELNRAEVRSSIRASQPGRAEGRFPYEVGTAQIR
jgi:hypothetical protein